MKLVSKAVGAYTPLSETGAKLAQMSVEQGGWREFVEPHEEVSLLSPSAVALILENTKRTLQQRGPSIIELQEADKQFGGLTPEQIFDVTTRVLMLSPLAALFSIQPTVRPWYAPVVYATYRTYQSETGEPSVDLGIGSDNITTRQTHLRPPQGKSLETVSTDSLVELVGRCVFEEALRGIGKRDFETGNDMVSVLEGAQSSLCIRTRHTCGHWALACPEVCLQIQDAFGERFIPSESPGDLTSDSWCSLAGVIPDLGLRIYRDENNVGDGVLVGVNDQYSLKASLVLGVYTVFLPTWTSFPQGDCYGSACMGVQAPLGYSAARWSPPA
jgi:hypothetical protein